MPTETPKTKGRTCGELCKPVAHKGQIWRHADGREGRLVACCDGFALVSDDEVVPSAVGSVYETSTVGRWRGWSATSSVTLPIGTVVERNDGALMVLQHDRCRYLVDGVNEKFFSARNYAVNGQVLAAGLDPSLVVRFNPDEE